MVKTARIAFASATVWSTVLVVASLTLPAYSGETESTDRTGAVSTTSTSATFVGENGWWGLVVAGFPLVACALVGGLLLGWDGRAARLAAALVVGLVGVVAFLGLLSIGIYVLPVLVALAVAVVASGPRPVPA